MRRHIKTFLGYLLTITLIFSDLSILAYAEETTKTTEDVVASSESVNSVVVSKEIVEEPEIISELTEKRDETTKYFAISDGTIKACIYPQNVHYLEEGKYKEIDNTLVETNEGGKTYYKNKKNDFSVKLPESFIEDYIEFSDENGYVKFKLKGATNKKIEKIEKEQKKKNTDKTVVNNVNDKAIFKSIKGNIDIEYDLSGNKLKETIILYKKTKNSFVFDVQTSAASAKINADNSISFFDSEGTELYIIASPYMTDSAGEYSNAIETKLIKNDTGYTLTYTPDYEWLSAKGREYPVKVDPTLFKAIYKETVTYNFVYDSFGRTSQILVGNQLLSETIYRDNYSSLVKRFNYGNGNYKTYTYDNQDRLISESINGTEIRTYVYDKSGNIAKITDHITNVTTLFRYDLIGRTVEMKTTDGQSMNFIYDKFNRLSLSKLLIDNIVFSSGYIYGDNTVDGQKTGLIYGVNLNGIQQLAYQYDELARLKNRTINTTTPFVTEYGYLEGGEANTTTTLVKTIKNGNDTLEYTYDELGNITSVSKNGTVTETYIYDSLGQLTGATYGGNTYTYSYDNGGNITEIKKNDVVIKSYTYGNSEWKDLLTAFNGQTITYDDIGNPLTYRNSLNFTWQNGRQLANVSQNGNAVATYIYDADGLRTSKTVNGTTTEYYWLNGTLYGQKTGNEYIFFLYDENGTVYGFIIQNGTEKLHYYYEFNLQGDIIGIIDSTGTKVVEYTFGAWGDILSVTGTLADTIGQKNPLRYRGYYYDTETGFYYVSSRYYDPEIGRFLNADSLINQNSIIGNNMFAYCLNNPVNMADNTGHLPFFVITAAIGAVAGAIAGGVIAAKNDKNVWAGIGIGAAAGALVGAGAGAAASAVLAGSATASTSAVIAGGTAFVNTISAGGIGAGATYIANNISRAVSNGGGQNVTQTVQTGKNVYYQVTSSQAAQTIANTGKLIPSSVEGSVCVLNFQPTLTQARQLGAQSVETVIRFSTNCTTFVPDLTVPFSGAYRNMINGTIQIFDIIEVGFR